MNLRTLPDLADEFDWEFVHRHFRGRAYHHDPAGNEVFADDDVERLLAAAKDADERFPEPE